MYKIIKSPLAKEDIQEAAKWYESQKVGLGKQFLKSIRQNVAFIKQHPKATAIRYSNVRTTFLDKFPYLIHYTIDEENETITISAVFHTSRNTDFWKRR